jgi:translation initiation factor 5A
MATKQASIGTLQRGSYIMIEGIASKVTGTQTSRPGKHGHAKVRLEAVGLIDGKKRIIVSPGHDHVEVPIIEKKIAQVLSISGNSANLMDNESYETFDLEIPEELKEKVVEGISVLYWDIVGDKLMKDVRSNE